MIWISEDDFSFDDDEMIEPNNTVRYPIRQRKE